MPAPIAVLPSTVIDQIAAGEVIERPASVVKELVDNAIDAGARTIAVEIVGGGRSLIRVVDDGCGMSAAEAVLSLERHATSKLRSVDDLWGLLTLGFRGEALPAIASVARLVLTTRLASELAATRVTVDAGRVADVSEVGAPVGTTVEVHELFRAVPARLKFLRGEATEAAHVTELVARVAMAHPELHLKLKYDGRVALDVPPDRDRLARARALLGPRVSARLVEVSGQDGAIRVHALLGAPDLAQTTTRGVQLFVGRRPVKDRGLLHAIAMGYGELVPRGRYPLAIAIVDVPAGAVDINVHPQKSEVRFADGNAVAAAVRHVVQAGVARAGWRVDAAAPVMMTAITSVQPPALPDGGLATPLAQRYGNQLEHARDRGWANVGAQAQLGFEPGPREWAQGIRDRSRSSRASEAAAHARAAYARTAAVAVAEPAPTLAFGSGPVEHSAGERAELEPGYFAQLRYLGQLDLTYLVCEAGAELVLIDQHVAHELVELARLKVADADHAVSVQRMLFPTTIDVAPELAKLAGDLRGVLAQVGYETDRSSDGTLALRAVPSGIRHGDPAELLRALLGRWAEDGAPSDAEQLERALAEIACHSVVRAGDRLSAGEAEALLRALDGVGDAPNPHGRPLMLRLPLTEIARRFGR